LRKRRVRDRQPDARTRHDVHRERSEGGPATLVQVSRRRPREPLSRVLQPQTDLASMGLSE